MALVVIGKVVRAIGLKGHLGVAGTEGALAGLERIALSRGEPGGGEPPLREVLEARPQGRLWAVLVEGVADRTAAERLVGVEVLAPREALGEAGEDRHWWADLEGLPVVTVSGEPVGKVTGLLETGAVDVLVVTGERGERLVPLAPYVEVDRAGGRIVVDPPEGLLEDEEAADRGR
ncbi:MAG: ribosome maturation factor RimM [Anaeromyxobacter sp.]